MGKTSVSEQNLKTVSQYLAWDFYNRQENHLMLASCFKNHGTGVKSISTGSISELSIMSLHCPCTQGGKATWFITSHSACLLFLCLPIQAPNDKHYRALKSGPPTVKYFFLFLYQACKIQSVDPEEVNSPAE